MSFADEAKRRGLRISRPRKSPLWKGPEEDGITFSLLSRFLTCRERFRLYVMEGLCAKGTFNHRIEYGNMWHICEEMVSTFGEADVFCPDPMYSRRLKEYAQTLATRYPLQRDDIEKWYNICKVQFPIYARYYAQDQLEDRTPLLSEESFNVPYKLPSGRTVRLRGKWDSVFLLRMSTEEKRRGVWLQENKTKGDIQPYETQRRLKRDFQTMIYLTALERWGQEKPNGLPRFQSPIRGVLYNVVRRPCSGGLHSIKQRQNEMAQEFYERLGEEIEGHPDYFFMRWEVPVTQKDIEKFRRQTLDPILEQLYSWYNWITSGVDIWTGKDDDPDSGEVRNWMHWIHPFGVWNALDEGGGTDLGEYLENGSEAGLQRIENLYPELE